MVKLRFRGAMWPVHGPQLLDGGGRLQARGQVVLYAQSFPAAPRRGDGRWFMPLVVTRDGLRWPTETFLL